MATRDDIDRLLRDWPFEPGEVSVRLVPASRGREVLQMRVDMGVLQLEVEGRPDGERPGGSPTYLEFLISQHAEEGESFRLTEERCGSADREFLQYYYRRICWLALREFNRARDDADHTLALMDFVRQHSLDEDWTASHEQYRPFVLFHRTQAAALAALEDSGPEAAVEEIGKGLERFRDFFERYESSDQFDSDELVQRLLDLKDTLRKQFHVPPSLSEQLAEAVASEQYELAARLRDEISKMARKTLDE